MHVRSSRNLPILAVLIAISLALDSAASAAPPALNFLAARLSGAEEVPARDTAARGTADFQLSPDETELRFVLVVNVIDNVVAAHVHAGAPGVNGPVIVMLFDGLVASGPTNGLLAMGRVERGVTPLPPSLGAVLTNAERFDVLIALMRSGGAYVNVHTNDGVAPVDTGPGDFPGGEIRGQIDPRP